MLETDIIFFDAAWNEADPPTYGQSKDLYASAKQYPDANPDISKQVSVPEKVSDTATKFVVSRPLNPNKDKTTPLEKGKEYKFVYATSSKGGM